MGMAASQARLLTLTARIHDVEYQAQSIQNAKVQLATQEDKVYEDYQKALNATSLTFTMMNGAETTTQIATFNNLFSINSATTGNFSDYVLIGKKGKVVVDNEIYVGYHEFKDLEIPNENAYAFAMYMMTGEEIGDPDDFASYLGAAEGSITENHDDDQVLMDAYDAVVAVFEDYEIYLGSDDSIYDESLFDDLDLDDAEYDEAMERYTNALNNYNRCLYTRGNYAAEIYAEMMEIDDFDPEDFNTGVFNYYVRMYQAIEQAGGCESIDNYIGMIEGGENPRTSSEWLTNMIQTGQMSIDKINEDRKTGKVTLMGTSPSSDTNLKYTTTTDIDKRALAQAEAKYEHEMRLIDKKDKSFDLDLSKLETERSALTTEYDSVKKVIQDNIDRTFGIFS